MKFVTQTGDQANRWTVMPLNAIEVAQVIHALRLAIAYQYIC
jgi:hypothetical protein